MSIRNKYGMDVTFQHLSTKKHRNGSYTYLTLYGRSVSGDSVAVHIADVKPYGFIKFSIKDWRNIAPIIFECIRWEESRRYIELLEKKKKDDDEFMSDTWYRST